MRSMAWRNSSMLQMWVLMANACSARTSGLQLSLWGADGYFTRPKPCLPPSTTVSLIIVHLHDHTPDTDDLGPRSTRAVDTSSRWSPARAVQDAPGAPRGVKPLGRRAGRRKASGSGGKCASRSAAKNAYAAMQSDA